DRRLKELKHASRSGLFRMPVQRAFSAKGFGTVVTGVPISGSIKPGEIVEILPQGLTGKVRGLQAFGEPCEEGRAGHRIAINIADVDYHALNRGCTVATPGYFKSALFFEGRFAYFHSLGFPLKNGTEVKVHAGTAEEMGCVILLDSQVMVPGQEGYIQVRLEKPMVVVPGDRFLLRRHSPATSLGGGIVVERSGRKAKRFKPFPLKLLDSKYSSLNEEAAALLNFEMQQWKNGFFTLKDMALAISQKEEIVKDLLDRFLTDGVVKASGQGLYIHKENLAELVARVEDALRHLHASDPLKPYIDTNLVRNHLRMEIGALQHALKIMETECRVETTKGGRVRIAGRAVTLDAEQERIVNALMSWLNKAGLNPPTLEEICAELKIKPQDAESLTGYLEASGMLKRISGYYLSIEVLERLKKVIRQCAKEHGEVKIPLIKEQLPTTRKYIIPIMEYLDGTGFTHREGDRRFLTHE
ncbi:MAG: SelB C-terminal domain-containing protein, partial [Planctomycetota bacterium]